MFETSAVRFLPSSICLAIILVIAGAEDSGVGDVVSVETINGVVNGKVETPIDGKTLNVFRGIPFAEPPVDDLRFRRPVPKRGWNHTINAFQFQSACPQNVKLFDVGEYMVNKNVSEDCLYLNVWSPVFDGTDLKPVMFWIHGGGFLAGSPSEEYYQGDILAAKGDVVVVSTAYRMNIFGFLYTGTGVGPGNVGLLDQVLALEWVRDNIRNFGGDPDQVTIFGESAGGWSVSLHILSPLSRHLFRNAVINSGAYIYSFADDSADDHINKWLKGAKMVGCANHDDRKFTRDTLKCLEDRNWEDLVYMTDSFDLIAGTVKVFTFVTVDGYFMPEHPTIMLKKGNFKKDLNLIISTVEDEGAFLLTNFNDSKMFDAINPQNFTYSEAYDYFKDMTSGLNSELPVNGGDAAKIYYTGLSDNDGYDVLRKTMGIGVGDYFLSCPTILFGKEVFRISGFKSNVYQYYFNSKFEDNFFCSHWMGVCHTNDYYPMFGIPFLDPGNYNDREREISTQMINYLSEFARTGVPAPQDGAEWQKYYTIDNQIIAPYYEIRNERNDSKFKTGFKINECEYLWKKYLLYSYNKKKPCNIWNCFCWC